MNSLCFLKIPSEYSVSLKDNFANLVISVPELDAHTVSYDVSSSCFSFVSFSSTKSKFLQWRHCVIRNVLKPQALKLQPYFQSVGEYNPVLVGTLKIW